VIEDYPDSGNASQGRKGGQVRASLGMRQLSITFPYVAVRDRSYSSMWLRGGNLRRWGDDGKYAND
jgi:hypothetical protein